MTGPETTPRSRALSRRDFLRIASVGLAAAALLTPWKQLLPTLKKRAPEGFHFPNGSLFRPRQRK